MIRHSETLAMLLLVLLTAAVPPTHAAQRIDPQLVDAPATLTAPVTERSSPAAILRAQVHLDRAGHSVGEIDARYGDNTRRAVAAFQRAHDLEASGTVDAATWAALGATVPSLVSYIVTPADVAQPFVAIPQDMMARAELPAQSFSTLLEALAEQVHASPALLVALNPGQPFDRAGTTLMVPNVAAESATQAASVVVDESDRSVQVLDADGRVVARYPASVGSAHDPLPVGTWKINGVARTPSFHYNPDLFWDADSSDTKATIKPGPNNPVGVVWIDLSKPHYGIHGTPEPSKISRTESHGCIRLTNWDAMRLAEQVRPGMPAVLTQ